MTFVRRIPLTAALLTALAGPAFAESHATETEATEVEAMTETEATSEAMQADSSTVVATVNGTEITLGHMIVMKQRLPQQYQQLPPDVLFEGILDQLVQQTLLGEEVDALSTGSQLALDNERRALYAAEELRRAVDEALTDEAIQAAYDETYGNAEAETEYNASHILVETEEEAQEILGLLQDGGEFAELAQRSIDPSGPPRGGELGWFAEGTMVPPFEEAVVAMEVGDLAGPVETQFGWHVIQLNETRLKEAPAIEQVRGQIAEQLQREAIEARVDELLSGADVTRSTAEEIDPALLDDLSLVGE